MKFPHPSNMTKPEAIQILRTLLNLPAVKLILNSADIATAEEALKTIAKEEPKE